MQSYPAIGSAASHPAIPRAQARIGLLTSAMECGGLQAYLLRLAAGLIERGFSVEIVTTDRKGEWFDLARASGLECTDLSSPRQFPPLQAWKVMRRIREREFDVLLLNHARFAQACLGLLPDHAIVLPVIHNDLDDIYLVGCANRRAWNAAVGVSPKIVRETKARVGRRPVFWIPNGVPLPSAQALAGRATHCAELKLAYVGRLDALQKNVRLLPDILAGCIARGLDVTLTIGGEGPALGDLREKVSRYGLENRVCFLGRVNPDAAYDILLRSHVLLLPSRFEGFPLVALEAQACGCVPVCSMLPGCTDIVVDDGQTGFLVEPGETSGFVAAVASLANSRAQWIRMSGAGQDRVRRLFSIDRMCDSYAGLIRESLSGAYPLPFSRRSQMPFQPRLFTWREYIAGACRP